MSDVIEKKVIKLPLSASVHDELEQRAAELGLKVNAYIQMILGQHVKSTAADSRKAG